MAVLAVQQDGAHAERAGAFDVLLEGVPDHRRLRGLDIELLQRRLEDRRVGLHVAVRARADDRVDVEPVVCDELAQIADPVRDEPETELRGAQLVEHGERVLVQLEVLRHFPTLLDLGRTLGRNLLRPAHPDEDLGREAVPDRVVMQKLWVALEVQCGRLACIVVAGRVERDAVT